MRGSDFDCALLQVLCCVAGRFSCVAVHTEKQATMEVRFEKTYLDYFGGEPAAWFCLLALHLLSKL